jgi:hypothetical protein
MPTTRRRFFAVALGTAALTCDGVVAQEQRGLFWRVEMPDGSCGTVFGYARVGAVVAPDVANDGLRFVAEANRVVFDMDNTRLPALKIDPTLPPLLPNLDPARANQLRNILAQTAAPAAQLESLPGFLIAFFVYSEGQTNPAPSVGGVIVDRARTLGRPMTALLNASDIEHLRKPVDFAQINRMVDDATITFLLDTRARVGPIGAYCERLYRERRGEDLQRFTKTMSERGVPESQTYIDGEAARQMMLTRLPVALRSERQGDSAFCLLPIGTLTGPRSILIAMRDQGARLTTLA